VAYQSISGVGWSDPPFTQSSKEHPTGHPTRTERETATGRLLIAYREEGDGRARDRLVQLYQPLVAAFASRCSGNGADYDDLAEVGSTALLNAIDRCDPKRGDDFLAFAVPAIAADLRRHLRDATEAGRSDGVPAELDERILGADVFQTLDDTERQIIYLCLVRAMADQEAAAQVGMSQDRLRRRTRAALAKLRGELERNAFPGAAQGRAARTNGAKDGGEDSSSAKAAHSGRILVRMPETLHDDLARAAEAEHVSLNQFITNALSAAIGWQQPPRPQRQSPRWLPAAIVTNIIVVVLAGIAAMILLLMALDKGL
jgi:RNA polymerase sigma factor (sigma-70 family)